MTVTNRITITTASSSGAHTSGDHLQHDAPATRPMPTVSAQRLALAITGGAPDGGTEAIAPSSTDPYLATGEPSIAEAAKLLSSILSSGAVARLDLLHDALTVAHRRGRAAERAAVQRIAHEHAGAFVAAVAARTAAEYRRAALPWCEQ